MNSTQAKQLSLPAILERLGFHPVQIGKEGRELWYQSPFRPERQASFHTSFLGEKWIWNDFGDRGGNVIDFAMRYQNFSRVSDALAWLDTLRIGKASFASPLPYQPSPQQDLFVDGTAASNEEEKLLELLSTKPISNPVIFSYLGEQRCLPIEIVRKYLKEVRYRNLNSGKEFFAFGMENQSGGFEIRVASNAYQFKSALPMRDISLIKGFLAESKIVNVFEGMTDFLSLLALNQVDNLKGDSIIMHSLTSFQRTLEIINRNGYQKVNTFLDNDRSGQETSHKFQMELGSMVEVQSGLFAPHKDLNDALREKSNKGRFL